MKQISRTGQFKRDVKRTVQAGKNVEKLKEMIEKIGGGESLDEKHRDHFLIGDGRNSDLSPP